LHAFEIGIDGGIDPGFHQEAADNQFRDLRRLDHHIEQIAEPATVAAARCCRHAQQHGVRVEAQQMLARAAPGAVRFVEDHKIGRR
jgi:hypothetical protein